MSNLSLAKKIATALLTTHCARGKVECTRLQLMLKHSEGSGEYNMGGRCKSSVVETILKVLNESAAQPTSRKSLHAAGRAPTRRRRLGV